MPSRFFITGTDTGIGKTLASALLCAGLNANYWKPIQTGTGVRGSEASDTKTVMRLAELSHEKIIPEVYRFAPPVSPHLAAKRAGVRIDLRKIRLPHLNDENLIVEGAGGVLVPVNGTQLMIDLMRKLGLPVLLVARTALGTINHTLLSLAALRAANIAVRGVIMSGPKNLDNRAAIEHYGDIQVVGWIRSRHIINRRALLRVFEKEFDPKAFA